MSFMVHISLEVIFHICYFTVTLFSILGCGSFESAQAGTAAKRRGSALLPSAAHPFLLALSLCQHSMHSEQGIFWVGFWTLALNHGIIGSVVQKHTGVTLDEGRVQELFCGLWVRRQLSIIFVGWWSHQSKMVITGFQDNSAGEVIHDAAWWNVWLWACCFAHQICSTMSKAHVHSPLPWNELLFTKETNTSFQSLHISKVGDQSKASAVCALITSGRKTASFNVICPEWRKYWHEVIHPYVLFENQQPVGRAEKQESLDEFLFWSSTLASDQGSAVCMGVNAKILLIGSPFLLLFDSKGRGGSWSSLTGCSGNKSFFILFLWNYCTVFAAPDNFWKQQPAEVYEGSCLA